MEFENMALRRIFGLGGWRKLHNEEFHNCHSAASIMRMIKSRGITWAEHAKFGEEKSM
jgi:hypothetical protein